MMVVLGGRERTEQEYRRAKRQEPAGTSVRTGPRPVVCGQGHIETAAATIFRAAPA